MKARGDVDACSVLLLRESTDSRSSVFWDLLDLLGSVAGIAGPRWVARLALVEIWPRTLKESVEGGGGEIRGHRSECEIKEGGYEGLVLSWGGH